MKDLKKDWEFNVLGIDNYRHSHSLQSYYDFIQKNHDQLAGDICEVGVYRGSSLLATAMLLKELNSDKIVWGFDSFEGFPGYHPKDNLENFQVLFNEGKISKEHYEDYLRNIEFKSFMNQSNVNVKNISSSGDFSENSLNELERKIAYLELDNIKLVKGDFASTMVNKKQTKTFFAALIDCDLYEGYNVSLPYVYDRLCKGGYIHLDEYYSLKFPGAKIATDEFFESKLEKPFMHPKETGAFERWGVLKK